MSLPSGRLSDNFPNAVAGFEEKLMRAGYLDADSELYISTRTVPDSTQVFRVTEGFPRLTRDGLPPAIVEAAYSLDERQLGDYRLNEGEFRRTLRQMGKCA